MRSRRLKIVLSYDGTKFFGWQIQNEGRTVQGVLEDVLSGMHKHHVRITAAGRTDSGVHSNGQVCHFDTELDIPQTKYKDAINSFLPDDVCVMKSTYTDDDFHARFSAKGRVYKYYLTDSMGSTVFNRYFCTSVRNLPGIESLNTCAGSLEGIHDFTTFTSAGDKSESRVREIYSAVFYIENNYTVFKIEGNAFLWKMVRSIVGSILKYAAIDDSGSGFLHALESKDRNMAGTTAPAKGLFFHKVYY